MRKMKFSIIFFLFFFYFLSATDISPVLKSRVIFKKNPSQSEISGWEKNFFKDYESEFAEKLEISDNEAEVSDNDQVQIKGAEKKIVRPKEIRKQSHIEIKNVEPVQEKITPVSKEIENVENDKLLQQPEKTNEKQKSAVLEPVSDNNDAKVEKNDSDNEVDRSEQIRKMKKLLKKRKGKNRIEDRRIY